MENILLVDGNSLLFKAFFATYKRLLDGNERSMQDDEPINAIRVFSFMILGLLEKFNPEYMLVAFDKGSKTFRHEYDFYKKNRKTPPQEIFPQFARAKEFLKIIGIKTMEFDEYEADDIIGIFSKLDYGEEKQINIITSDKDLLQLVDDNVDVYLSKSGIKVMDHFCSSNFKEKNLVEPCQIPDLKALVGDPSDNIKGISGIGPKSALEIINNFNDIENILLNLDELKDSWKNKIEKEKDQLKEYKKLTTIITENQKEFKKEDIIRGVFKKEEAIIFLNRLSIFNVANKISKDF